MLNDEYKQGIKDVVTFLNENISTLKKGKWELRGQALRDCDGNCPILFLAKQKEKVSPYAGKENWWEVNVDLNLNHMAGVILASIADKQEHLNSDYNEELRQHFENYQQVRDFLITELQPVKNDNFGIPLGVKNE